MIRIQHCKLLSVLRMQYSYLSEHPIIKALRRIANLMHLATAIYWYTLNFLRCVVYYIREVGIGGPLIDGSSGTRLSKTLSLIIF